MSKKAKIKARLRRSTLLVIAYRNARGLVATTRGIILRLARITTITKWRQFKNFTLNHQLDKSDFVPITNEPHRGDASKKLIAYYLPQYYQIPQNDEWFGRGFTEWTNTSKAVSQFIGHWQPHVPIDVGYYNLETTHVMQRQVELAKMYGIHGFCFYYYWFSGRERIMEKPVHNWLDDKSLDFPFMFFWANEDWTNTWGAESDLGAKTYSAKMKPEDVKLFVDDIIPFLKDDRYITVDGRPHIIIYQAKKDPYLREFIENIGTEIEKRDTKSPYISLVFPDDFDGDFNPKDYGADAAVEFGAHLRVMPSEVSKLHMASKLMNPKAKIVEYDMEAYINSPSISIESSYPVFKGAMTYFDNTARKIYTGAELFPITPPLYKKWLSNSIAVSKTDQVFIAAWNEWAEGMHLEPDNKYGYAYLQATKDALEEAENN